MITLDGFFATLTMSFIAGAVLTIVGLNVGHKLKREAYDESDDDKSSFMRVSEAIFAELDTKKAELIAIYDQIEERKGSSCIDSFVGESSKQRPIPGSAARALKLKDAGLSTADIARELGIGQGEVSLMTNLYGDNNA